MREENTKQRRKAKSTTNMDSAFICVN